MDYQNDPIGKAILDFSRSKSPTQIIVQSDLCDDDTIETAYLFRSFEAMPILEKTALKMTSGKTLDVGACAGCHSMYLKKKNKKVISLDVSKGSIDYLNSQGLDTIHKDILAFAEDKFDTILLLMNGLGLAKTLSELPAFLLHLKSLLTPNGSILCDSSDIKYLYEDQEGAIWVDLNSSYYGEMKFNMQYQDSQSGWFDWLYVDFDTLHNTCENNGLVCKKIMEDDNHQYLAQIK